MEREGQNPVKHVFEPMHRQIAELKSTTERNWKQGVVTALEDLAFACEQLAARIQMQEDQLEMLAERFKQIDQDLQTALAWTP